MGAIRGRATLRSVAVPRRLAPLALAVTVTCLGSCTSILLPHVEVGNAPVNERCTHIIAREFTAAGFVPVSWMPNGPPMLFAPRTTGPLTFSMTLGWAVGVSFSQEDPASCPFHLQALDTQPDCMPEACLMSRLPQEANFDGRGGQDSTLALPSLAPAGSACYGITFTCPLSPTGSRQHTAALAELTRRIRAALDKEKSRPSGAR